MNTNTSSVVNCISLLCHFQTTALFDFNTHRKLKTRECAELIARIAWEAHHHRRRDHTREELQSVAAGMSPVHAALLRDAVLPNIAEGRLPLFQASAAQHILGRRIRRFARPIKSASFRVSVVGQSV